MPSFATQPSTGIVPQRFGPNRGIAFDLGVELACGLYSSGANPVLKVPIAARVGYVKLVVVNSLYFPGEVGKSRPDGQDFFEPSDQGPIGGRRN